MLLASLYKKFPRCARNLYHLIEKCGDDWLKFGDFQNENLIWLAFFMIFSALKEKKIPRCARSLSSRRSQKSPSLHLLASRRRNLRLYSCWQVVLKDTKRGVVDDGGADKRSLTESPKTPCRQTDLQEKILRQKRKNRT